MKNIGYAAKSSTSPMEIYGFEVRELRPHDVLIDILFCGVCHSDLHMVKNEWKNTIYPVVPGHEIVGRVCKTGGDATGFKEGDLVAVGCIIGSCGTCPCCEKHLQQYCESGFTLTFNTKDRVSGLMNYGGFSEQIVVEDQYVLRIPDRFQEKDLAAVAPLLCAGITTYSPLRNWNIGQGSKVGVVGLGGLGHLAVKIAHAMGAHVVAFTTSQEKAEEARKLGADEVVYSKDSKAMAPHKKSLDFILSTVAASYDLNPYLDLLGFDGSMCLVGLPSSAHPSVRADLLINKRRNLSGSLIGSIKETQELLEFCAEHNILADIELISIDQINEAFDRMLKGDVKYRFVIDMQSLKT